MGLFDTLFGGGTQTVKQTYEYSPLEISLINELQKYLKGGQAFGEARRFLAPDIAGLERQARMSSAPFGGGAGIISDLQAKSMGSDLVSRMGIQGQQQVRGLLGSLVGGKGTQTSTTQQPMDFSGLGQLIGYFLAMQGGGGGSLAGQPAMQRR